MNVLDTESVALAKKLSKEIENVETTRVASIIYYTNNKQLEPVASFATMFRCLRTMISTFVIRTQPPLNPADLHTVYTDSVSVGTSVARLSISLLVPTIKLIRGISTGIVQAFTTPVIRRRANSIG